MARTQTIDEKISAIQDLLNAKFGVRKRDLAKMLRRTGRRLPKRMHARAQVLVDAQARAQNPKLARMTEAGEVKRAYKELTAHLAAINVADRRKGLALGIAGNVAFNILVVAAGFVAWLWWRGYV